MDQSSRLGATDMNPSRMQPGLHLVRSWRIVKAVVNCFALPAVDLMAVAAVLLYPRRESLGGNNLETVPSTGFCGAVNLLFDLWGLNLMWFGVEMVAAALLVSLIWVFLVERGRGKKDSGVARGMKVSCRVEYLG